MEPTRLSDIAKWLGGRLLGDDDPCINGLANLEDAGSQDLTFIKNRKMLARLKKSQAGAVLVGPDLSVTIPAIVVDDAHLAFARLLAQLEPDLDRVFPPGIHPTAVIDPQADVALATSIGPFCVVGAGTQLGAGTRLASHVVIGPDVRIGSDCRLYAHTSVREGCVLGNDIVLHAGCCIGTEGFGFIGGPAGLEKVPQVGIVVLEDGVEIGSGTCVDRATTGRTLIRQGTKIDNQVQIGHNVHIGQHCAISAQTGISGSCVVGNGVFAGGGTGIADHINVGDGAKLGARSGVIRDIPAGLAVFGRPALEFNESFRIIAAWRKLPELLKRVRRLEKQVHTEESGEK